MNMEILTEITSIAKNIYSLVEKVKANKKRSQRVGLHVKALDELVRSIKEEQTCEMVKKCLTELSCTLTRAMELIQSYTEDTWLERLLKVGSHEDGFNYVNDRLTDAYQNLSLALQLNLSTVLHQVFEVVSRREENRAEDEAVLKTQLLEYMQEQQRDKEIHKNDVEKILHEMAQPSITDRQIQNIKRCDLKFDNVKKPFMVTANTEVYKGEFNGFPVAIKRYVDPLNISQSELEKIFDREVETMRRFESPNILRMFGICVESGPGTIPRFLIIMEYCEKGSLRDVLDSDWAALSWPTRARMCRDAARGLYRLHQTEKKSKVHGCLNSNKFLVAEGYTVKLGGFELAKTETSLRKTTRRKESISSLCYTSPEMLNDVNLDYSKESEIYSLGIVMWEIASGRRPFDGWSNEIKNKVCNEKFKEELPSDCPEELARLIDDCRDYDQFCRPSAGVLVDKLPSVVAQIDRP